MQGRELHEDGIEVQVLLQRHSIPLSSLSEPWLPGCLGPSAQYLRQEPTIGIADERLYRCLSLDLPHFLTFPMRQEQPKKPAVDSSLDGSDQFAFAKASSIICGNPETILTVRTGISRILRAKRSTIAGRAGRRTGGFGGRPNRCLSSYGQGVVSEDHRSGWQNPILCPQG